MKAKPTPPLLTPKEKEDAAYQAIARVLWNYMQKKAAEQQQATAERPEKVKEV